MHNTLEATIHGNFVLFGPKYSQFPETLFFIEKKIGKSIKNKVEFNTQIRLFLRTPTKKQKIKRIVHDFVEKNKSNTANIINFLRK